MAPKNLHMLSRNLKSRLASGEALHGLFVFTMSPTICEIAGLAGYDYVILDMEHGPGGFPEALHCLHALASTNTPVIIRVPEISPLWAMRALDLGPQGILFPGVESVKEAELAVSYCRYPPRGNRGTAHMMVRQSAYGLDDAYLSRCEEDLLIMCQVETVPGLQEVRAIASVDGVDVIQTGPRDLSASMGYISDPSNINVMDVLKEAEKRVLSLANKNGAAYLGGIASPHDPPEQLKLRGYNMVVGAVDIAMFKQAVVEALKRFRVAGMEITVEENDKVKEKNGYSNGHGYENGKLKIDDEIKEMNGYSNGHGHENGESKIDDEINEKNGYCNEHGDNGQGKIGASILV